MAVKFWVGMKRKWMRFVTSLLIIGCFFSNCQVLYLVQFKQILCSAIWCSQMRTSWLTVMHLFVFSMKGDWQGLPCQFCFYRWFEHHNNAEVLWNGFSWCCSRTLAYKINDLLKTDLSIINSSRTNAGNCSLSRFCLWKWFTILESHHRVQRCRLNGEERSLSELNL